MPGPARASAASWRGRPSVVLEAGGVRATFLPTLGMLGVSLRIDGGEHLALPGGIQHWLEGHTTGLPLLHPFANRLSGDRYRAGRETVSLEGLATVNRDGAGLPIHGWMSGARRWQVVSLCSNDRRATLVADFDHSAPDLLEGFPFPHELRLEASVDHDGLEVTTRLRPLGRRAVPVSFGWHPYLRVPGARRGDLELTLPARRHLELDARGIPTGRSEPEPAGSVVPAGRGLDEAYRVARRSSATLAAATPAAGRRGVVLRLREGYDHLQVYAPTGRSYAAIEPMTAVTNALVTGAHPTVPPGDQFSATFRIDRLC